MNASRFRILSPWQSRLKSRHRPYVCDVGHWHITDAPPAPTNVRFEGNNGHDADVTQCLLLTLSGHRLDSPSVSLVDQQVQVTPPSGSVLGPQPSLLHPNPKPAQMASPSSEPSLWQVATSDRAAVGRPLRRSASFACLAARPCALDFATEQVTPPSGELDMPPPTKPQAVSNAEQSAAPAGLHVAEPDLVCLGGVVRPDPP